MRNLALFLSFAAVPLIAQTRKPPVHRTYARTHRPATAECATLPELSPKIPALPPGTPCAKPLYTITRRPDFTLDYASPLVNPELRKLLDAQPSTFSLDYIDTKIGTGPLALPHMWYTVRYTGYLADGAKFDSSYDHPGEKPITFPYGQHRVIEGWDTGFEGMHVGGKRRLFVPYELGYGANGRPPRIPAKAELVFDLELVSQSATPPPPPRRPVPARPHPAVKPQPAPSSAGRTAPPPVTSSTPATSTKPAPPTGAKTKQ